MHFSKEALGEQTYRGNHEQLLESIRTKLFTLPEETEVYSGHGNATQIGFEKIHNPFF